MCGAGGPIIDDHERLTPVSRDDLANALAYALRLVGRNRVDNADEIMAWIVARRLVDRLKGTGFVVMKRLPRRRRGARSRA